MSTEPPFRCHSLGAGDQSAYRIHTFPALRHLLDNAGDARILAVGAVDGSNRPVGLALGHPSIAADDGQWAQLLSLYVQPESRGAGVGSGLLSAFGALCLERGLPEIRATYMTGQSSTATLERFLASSGWSAPEGRMLVIQATLESIKAAPWMKTFALPDRMEVVRWLDLTEQDRSGIRDSQREQAWVPADLYPFDHEANCEPVTSLALKLEGRVVGWVINHRVEGVLRFTCSFVHRRLQRMGRILLLYNESVARMPLAGLQVGMWTVPVWHPAMAAFARRWMAPYATRFEETRGVRLRLAQPPDNHAHRNGGNTATNPTG
ncbi:GNAT family N-acetyltransferase [Caenimonas terrae]|uniref:GNAT family N-acetyltransferase n=1 Tax=Caenimonas terrae TaxID=696074 RepID=A0ABW0N8V9_9BURK